MCWVITKRAEDNPSWKLIKQVMSSSLAFGLWNIQLHCFNFRFPTPGVLCCIQMRTTYSCGYLLPCVYSCKVIIPILSSKVWPAFPWKNKRKYVSFFSCAHEMQTNAQSKQQDWTNARMKLQDWTNAPTKLKDWTNARMELQDWSNAWTKLQYWTNAQTKLCKIELTIEQNFKIEL